MSDTVFVTMYHPALGNVQVDAPLIAVPTYQSHGWLLLDPNATPPPIATPYLTQSAGDSRYVRDWAGAETVTAGAIRMAPDGHVIVRIADGTTRSSYDTTETAAWTPVGGQTAAQLAADPAVRAAFVAHDAQTIDLCAAPYNATPGADITSALQSAINAIAASGQSGKILITKVGTYLLSGPLQTGSYTGSAGTGDLQGGGVTHTWNAQIIFPALPFSNVAAPAITIEGAVIPSRGWKFTGDAQGVQIVSTITSGKMFEAASGYDGWGKTWTGIETIFRNLILRLPDNPTAGAIDVQHTLRAEIEHVAVLTTNAWVIPTAGNISTAVAIALPSSLENGDVDVRNVDVRGYPSAFRISEHAVFNNVQIVGCQVAFISSGGGHCNFFYGVDVEECATVFKMEAGATVYLKLIGDLDVESNGTWPTMVLLNSATGAAPVMGQISVTDALGTIGGVGELDILSPIAASDGAGGGAGGSGWKALNPTDNFQRCGKRGLPNKAAGAPGLCNPTMHPWSAIQGDFTISAGASPSMTQAAGGNTAQAGLPVLDAKTWGRPRRVSATLALAATGNRSVALFAGRNPDTSNGIYASLYNGNLYLKVGSYASHAGYVATVPASAATAGATVTLDLEVHYANQRPAVVKVYLNRTLLLSYALSVTDLATLALGGFLPYLHDGVSFSDADTNTGVTSFTVRDIASTNVLTSGTATLVAGTVSVADPRVTTSSVVRLNRQAAGGTLGELSVALTAGTGFAINSNSATDTSSVYYEVVSY